MVNADRVKRKLPCLLFDKNTNSLDGWKAFMRNRSHFQQFKKRHPDKFSSLTNGVLADLAEFEKAVNEGIKKIRKIFGQRRSMERVTKFFLTINRYCCLESEHGCRCYYLINSGMLLKLRK